MGENFNIRDAEWDPFVSSHPITGQALKNLADSNSLMHSILALPVLTHYSGIQDHTNTVIDLIFLDMSYAQVFYCIKPDIR